MRKYIYVILFLIISLGCTGEMDHVSNTETSNTQSIDQHGKSNDESGVLLFDAKNVIPYGDSQTQKEHPVTIIKVEDGYRAYRNQNLDFSNLTLEVTAFDPASNTKALCVVIQMPEEWPDDVKAWMAHDGLRLCFEIDNKPVNAFARRIKTVSNNTITFEFRACVLKAYELSGKKLSIRLYVEHTSIIYTYKAEIIGDKGGYESFQLDAGDIYRMKLNSKEDSDRILYTKTTRIYLDHASLLVALHQDTFTAQDAPIVMVPLVFAEVDRAAMEEAGMLENDGEYYEIGTVYVRNKNVAAASLVINEMHFWDDGIELSYTWRFPDDWTDKECQAILRGKLGFYCYLDDNKPYGKINLYAADSPFGNSKYMNFGSASDDYEGDNEFTEDKPIRELHYRILWSNMNAEEWKTHQTFTLVPYIYREGNLDIPEEGVSMDSYYRNLSAPTEMIWLHELAVTIHLTPELFEQENETDS